MSPGEREGRPGKDALEISQPRLALDSSSLPRVVSADAYLVVGVRGRLRAVLLVRCPYCSAVHQHGAAATFSSGRRQASCHGGRYVVHAAVLEVAA